MTVSVARLWPRCSPIYLFLLIAAQCVCQPAVPLPSESGHSLQASEGEPLADLADFEMDDTCVAGRGGSAGNQCSLSLLQMKARQVASSSKDKKSASDISHQRDRPSRQREEVQHNSSRLHLATRSRSRQRQRRTYRQRRKRRASGHDGATYFTEAYGDGFSWFTGVIADDELHIAGATGKGQFGLLQMGAGNIGNSYPMDNGPSVDDGIMGLAPGCLDTACKHVTDPVSSLVDDGVISKHVFTMCFDDGSEGGGMIYFGQPDASLLAGARRFPLQPVPRAAQSESYEFEAPISSTHSLKTASAEAPIVFNVGHVAIASMTSMDFDAGQSFIDTGTGGLMVPDFMWPAICDAVTLALWENPSIADIFQEESADWLYNALLSGELVLTLDPNQAKLVQEAVPDFWFEVPTVGNITVSGSTFFFQTTPCSGAYWMSWGPGGGGTSFAFGTAFLWGKTVLFDHSDPLAPSFWLLGAAAGCKTDYSEKGYKMPIYASKSQALNGDVGAYTAEIALGSPPQKLVVQLDTGSQDLLVYQKSCVSLGLPDCMDRTCQSCFYVIPINALEIVMVPWSPYADYYGPGSAGVELSSACMSYIKPLLDALNATGHARNMSVPGMWYLGNFSIPAFQQAAEQTMLPWAYCGASRAACGRLRVFDPSKSETFSMVPSGARLPLISAHAPPTFVDPGLQCSVC